MNGKLNSRKKEIIMKDLDIYWQDAVAAVAGIWLMLTLGLEISTAGIAVGWIAYVGGALAVMFATGGFASKNPVFSWAAAAMGIIAMLTPFIFGFADDIVLVLSMVVGGALVAGMSAWSAMIKKKVYSSTETPAT
jgi:hypothetical protein